MLKKLNNFTIPKLQKAVVFEKHKGPLIYKDVPVPVPKSNEILVNVKYSGVCHSDVSIWNGYWPKPLKLPLIGGHEGAGVVVAKGDNVTNFEIGDLAGVKILNKTCMTCELCTTGYEASCPHQEMTGYTTNGTFLQYTTSDAIQAAPIPQGTNLAEIAPFLCAGVTVYKGLKTANLKPGDWVAISGAGGGLGSLAVQYANAMGFRVIGIDGGDEKHEYVKSLGAEVFVDYTKSKDIVGEIREKTKGGAHGVINVAVSEQAVTQSLKYVRAAGKVVLISCPEHGVAQVPIFEHVLQSLSLLGSCVGSRSDMNEAIEFYSRGKVKSKVHIVGLSEVEKVFALLHEGKVVGRYVLDTSR